MVYRNSRGLKWRLVCFLKREEQVRSDLCFNCAAWFIFMSQNANSSCVAFGIICLIVANDWIRVNLHIISSYFMDH